MHTTVLLEYKRTKPKRGGEPGRPGYITRISTPRKTTKKASINHGNYKGEGEENSSPSSNFRFLVESVEPTGPSKSTSSRKKASESSSSIAPLPPGEATGEENTSAALRTELGLGMYRGEAVEVGSGSTTVGSGATEAAKPGSAGPQTGDKASPPEGSQVTLPLPLSRGLTGRTPEVERAGLVGSTILIPTEGWGFRGLAGSLEEERPRFLVEIRIHLSEEAEPPGGPEEGEGSERRWASNCSTMTSILGGVGKEGQRSRM